MSIRHYKLIRSFIIFITIILNTSCIKPIPLPAEFSGQNIFTHLKNDASQRQQLVALIKARLAGVKAILGNIQFDVIAQQPSNLYLATRSFFTQPSHIFSYNGFIARYLDASEINNPRFIESERGEDLLKLLLGFSLSPSDATQIFLGSTDLKQEHIKNIEYDERKGIQKIIYSSDENTLKTIHYNVVTQTIVAYYYENKSQRLSYHANLSDFKNIAGIAFAHQWKIFVKNNRQHFEIVLNAQEVQLNGTSFDAEAFDVAQP